MKTKKFLAFSCLHMPFHDVGAVEFLFQQIKKHKPDVIVNLGDSHEADASSRFPSEETHNLEHEFKIHNEFCQRLLDSRPEAKFVFMEGNHDLAIRDQHRINKKVRSLCDYRKHEPALKHFKFFPYEHSRKAVFRLGQVSFMHGVKCGNNAGKYHSIRYGKPYGLMVDGHTHSILPVSQVYASPKLPLPYWHANAGTLRDMNPHYMLRNDKGSWGQGVVVGEAQELKSPRESRCWEAETLVYKMADEELYS